MVRSSSMNSCPSLKLEAFKLIEKCVLEFRHCGRQLRKLPVTIWNPKRLCGCLTSLSVIELKAHIVTLQPFNLPIQREWRVEPRVRNPSSVVTCSGSRCSEVRTVCKVRSDTPQNIIVGPPMDTKSCSKPTRVSISTTNDLPTSTESVFNVSPHGSCRNARFFCDCAIKACTWN